MGKSKTKGRKNKARRTKAKGSPSRRRPTLVIPIDTTMFGQPIENKNVYRSHKVSKYHNKANPFSGLNYKNKEVQKYIKSQIKKRNRTLRLMQYKKRKNTTRKR
uniref:Uncharacterized protein n=1 Tax=Megaviridae environmental sample TaxID=1737588 RepID=A0A5J6VNM0_9VIRU|nr:MAG: hypothetical protein [Megaviridae environmental sample]